MINLEIVKSVTIPLPPIDVQRQLVRSYAAVRREVASLASLQAQSGLLLEERKQTLITAAVTGQFDVMKARAVT